MNRRPRKRVYHHQRARALHQRMQEAALMGGEFIKFGEFVVYLHLKYGKVPVYSANHWIDSFAQTVYDVMSQQSINLLQR